jgi:hypothetical protein
VAKAQHDDALLLPQDGLVHGVAAVQVRQQVAHGLALLLLALLLLPLLCCGARVCCEQQCWRRSRCCWCVSAGPLELCPLLLSPARCGST